MENINKIVSGTTITGDINSEVNIVIEGEVRGNINCSSKVTIGSSGKVQGNINCVLAEIEGEMDGELNIENLLILKSSSRILGDIQTLKLNIEEGAYFEGKCIMSTNSNQSYKNQVLEFDQEE
jgi:cytoskeletal protein CcmA (bactofilin family)